MRKRFEVLRPVLDERLRRLWAAAEAMALGARGVTILSQTTGLSKSTIRVGIKQLREPSHGVWAEFTKTARARKPGGGRKSTVERVCGIEEALENLMESRESGEPGPLRWTCKSLRNLAEELHAAGHSMSYRTVGNLLHRLGYSFGRRGDYKRWCQDKRRDGFRRIGAIAASFLADGEPVLSVQLQASPEAAAAAGYLVVSSLLSWWQQCGIPKFPRARRMLLIAESEACGSALRTSIDIFAAENRLDLSVAHIPPGAWRWERSSRQAACSCSLLKAPREATVIGARLDLVLPSLRVP